MGNQSSATSILNTKQLIGNLQRQTPLSARNLSSTEVHEIYSNSHQHHELILHKIRIKKQYTCPHLIKIIDSHTLQSQNICSTVIKTYIVIEKPKTLLETIQNKLDLEQKFDEKELIDILYGCTEGLLFLLETNTKIKRLNTNNIFIDDKGVAKIMDPQFTDSMMTNSEYSETQIVKNLGTVIRSVLEIKKIRGNYSEMFLEFINSLEKQDFNLKQLQEQIILLREKTQRYSETSGSLFTKKNHRPLCLESDRGLSQLKNSFTITSNRSEGRSITISQTSKHSVKPSKKLKLKSVCTEKPKKYAQQNKENCHHKNLSSKINRLEFFRDQNLVKTCKTEIEINHCFPQKLNLRQRKNNREGDHHRAYKTLAEFSDSDERIEQSNLITYHIDKETMVSQVSREQPAYLIDFLDKSMSYISERESQMPRFSNIYLRNSQKSFSQEQEK